jgi:hypothetical protein
MEFLENKSNHAIAGAARPLNYGFPDNLTTDFARIGKQESDPAVGLDVAEGRCAGFEIICAGRRVGSL